MLKVLPEPKVLKVRLHQLLVHRVLLVPRAHKVLKVQLEPRAHKAILVLKAPKVLKVQLVRKVLQQL